MEGSAARWRNSRAGELLSRCCRGEAIGVDGNNGHRIGAWVPVLITGVLTFWVTSGIALADPSLPDPSAPVDAASSAASSATDTASGAVDSATSAADDVVTAASNEAESAGDSAVSTAESAAEAASSAGGGASSASQAGGASSASQAGGGSPGAPSSAAAGGSTGSTPSSPAGSPSDAGSGNATAGDRTSGGRGERGKLVSRYDGSANHDAGGRGRDEGRGGRARQAPRDADGPTPGGDDDGGRIGDLTELVQSGQEIGDSTTVSVVASSDGSDDPPLFEGLPITGFEVSVFFAAGAGLASLGVALLSYARERSGDSGRPRLS